MALSDELSKLQELHRAGALTDEEYARAKARVLEAGPAGPAAPVAPALAAVNALRRSRGDRWIAGVCGGLAPATGAESWVWRLVFAALLLFGGVGLLIYLLLWIFVPPE
jgi:phage shock protein PspC (stress-responsive transcriptional regulator)